MTLGTLKHPVLNKIAKPDPYHSNPFGFRFAFCYNGGSIEKDTPQFIISVAQKELRRRQCDKQKQGLLFRLDRTMSIDPKKIGWNSPLRKIISGTAISHSRKIYKSNKYRRATDIIIAKQERTE